MQILSEGSTVDHLYGTGDQIGIRLVTRVAMTVESEDGQQKSAVPTGVTAMMLQGVRDDDTRLGYPMIWVPAKELLQSYLDRDAVVQS